jgi:hypothetical protein
MVEYKAIIAGDLVPLMKHLYKGGVLAVNGHDGSVHMTVELFHKTFPAIEAEETGYGDYPFRFEAVVDGVMFFALSETGEVQG